MPPALRSTVPSAPAALRLRRGARQGLGDEPVEELGESHHRVDPQVPGERARDGVHLVDEELVHAVGEEVDARDAAQRHETGEAARRLSQRVGEPGGQRRGELARGARHALATRRTYPRSRGSRRSG